ncbi:hypothetical protein HDU86_005516 [Geranomyces michiganensis]|nr:hypothetical protein HDU86_005516 [Geranomyces michiganensis]
MRFRSLPPLLLSFCLVVVPVHAILRWIPITQIGEVPPTTLDGSAHVSLPSLNATIFVGGFNNENRTFSDFYNVSNIWKEPPEITAVDTTWIVQSEIDASGAPTWTWTSGPAFGARAGGVAAAATADGTKVVRWGGVEPGVALQYPGVATQDAQLGVVFEMSVGPGLSLGAWIPVTTTNDPPPVAFSKAVIYGGQFITLGGVDSSVPVVVNTINSLSLDTGAWTTLTPAGETLPPVWGHNAQLLYDFPLRRAVKPLAGMPAAAETSDVILIFGGMLYDDGGFCIREIWGSGSWCYLAGPGFAYDLVGNVMYTLDTAGTGFPQRIHATSQIAQVDGETVVSVTGGLYGDSTYVYWYWSDTYFYSLKTLEWRQASVANAASVPHRMQAICGVFPHLSYGYGSTFPKRTYTDAWMLAEYGGAALKSILTNPSTPPLADGSKTTYMLTVRDYRGERLDYGGEAVSGFMMDQVGRATLGGVTDYDNGTYAIEFSLSRAGAYRLLVMYNGESVFTSGSRAVFVKEGAPDAQKSTVDVSAAFRDFNTTVLVKVLDVSGNPIAQEDAMAAVTVAVSGAGLNRRSVLLKKVWADGYVRCTFVPTTLGTVNIDVRLNGVAIGESALQITVSNAELVPSSLRSQSGGFILIVITTCISVLLFAFTSAILLRSGPRITSPDELRWLLALTAPTVAFGCGYTLVVLLPASRATCTLQPWLAALSLVAPTSGLLAKGWTLRMQWEESKIKMRNVDVPASRVWVLNGLCHAPVLILLTIWTSKRTVSSLEAPLTRSVCEPDTHSISYPTSFLLALLLGTLCLVAARLATLGERVRRRAPATNNTVQFTAIKSNERNPAREAYFVAGLSALCGAIAVVVLAVTLTPIPGGAGAGGGMGYEARAILSVELCLVLGIVLQAAALVPAAMEAGTHLGWSKAASDDWDAAEKEGGGGGYAPNKELATAFWAEVSASRDLFEVQAEAELMRQTSGGKDEPWRPAVVTAFVAATSSMQYLRGRHFDNPAAAIALNGVIAPRLICLKPGRRSMSGSGRVDKDATAVAVAAGMSRTSVVPAPIVTFGTSSADRIRLRFRDLAAASRWLTVMQSIEIIEEKVGSSGGSGPRDTPSNIGGEKKELPLRALESGAGKPKASGVIEEGEEDSE